MKRGRAVLGIVLLAMVGGTFLFYESLRPIGGKPTYLRVDRPTPLSEVIDRMDVLRSAQSTGLLARLLGRPTTVPVGTYRVSGSWPAWTNLRSLGRPIVQSVRLPQTNWAKRTANVLQKKQVCTAAAYMAEWSHPEGRGTDFPISGPNLEGYLYPDTYDLPPLLGAKGVVERQLKAFRDKVWEPLNHPKDLYTILKIASLVELEAGPDDERPLIAGVIENRLKKGMRLQIDASLLYGMGKWRRLYFRDYREFDSPYNLYRHAGLPPTPICSPSIKSIRAAMAPARHNSLYYVAMPGGHSLFAADYKEHKRNIEKRKEALKKR